MKKSGLSKYAQGSAELVVAHAAWQKSKGRNPSLSFVGVRNPRKALSAAKSIIQSVQWTKLADLVGASIVRQKLYCKMNDTEIKIAVRLIITSSSSEEEVQQRVRQELGYPYDISLCVSIPNDTVGIEARELVRGLGGLVMKNGAMAMAMMHGHDGTISI